MSELPVMKIQRFSTRDGPGLRTTVFLKGCPLRCTWCHNPESQSRKAEFFYTPTLCIGCGKCVSVCPNGVHSFCGGEHTLRRELCHGNGECCVSCPSEALEAVSREMSVEEILREVEKDVSFYDKTGGVTLSGGEPVLHGEKMLELLKGIKARKIGTAIETCGYFDEKYVIPLVETVDLFLWDLKDTNDERHKKNTGASPRKILENLFSVDKRGGKTVLRCIMINDVNTDVRHLDEIAKIFRTLKNCLRVEIFSYHHYGESKYRMLGKAYPGKKEWMVSAEKLKEICTYLKSRGVNRLKID